MTTALITGATAGIGRAFADKLAGRGDRLVLVARDSGRLDETAERLRALGAAHVRTLPADLASAEGRAAVEQRLADAADPVDLLVNNAGFGLAHGFVGGPVEDEERLLDVHVRAVLRLTAAALPGMIDRRQGEILNVSSTAAFVPRGTYSAAKAWVVTFTESLAAELRGSGVRAMVVCPGFTHTEFHQRGDISTSDVPEWMWLEPGDVVDTALRDLRRGVVVSVPGLQYKALTTASRFVPRALRTAAGRRVSKRW